MRGLEETDVSFVSPREKPPVGNNAVLSSKSIVMTQPGKVFFYLRLSSDPPQIILCPVILMKPGETLCGTDDTEEFILQTRSDPKNVYLRRWITRYKKTAMVLPGPQAAWNIKSSLAFIYTIKCIDIAYIYNITTSGTTRQLDICHLYVVSAASAKHWFQTVSTFKLSEMCLN